MDECSNHALFNKLCPISKERKNRGEAQELILRYFAYSDRYQRFVHRVDDFLDEYMKDKHENGFELSNLKFQFEQMLRFVDNYFPNGFKKGPNFNTTPRVRFEAISVGVTLALNEKIDLIPKNVEAWLKSDEFAQKTTSDAANNRNKVIERIEYVKNKLLN